MFGIPTEQHLCLIPTLPPIHLSIIDTRALVFTTSPTLENICTIFTQKQWVQKVQKTRNRRGLSARWKGLGAGCNVIEVSTIVRWEATINTSCAIPAPPYAGKAREAARKINEEHAKVAKKSRRQLTCDCVVPSLHDHHSRESARPMHCPR